MGKTSLLESIHVLLTARSFRSSSLDHLIRENEKSFLLRARLQLPTISSALRPSRIGIQKPARKPPIVSVDGERLRSASKLASILPVQILDHDSINIVFGEPALRRRFLDWGVFHVEPPFAALIQNWRQVLAQRNAAIKDARIRGRFRDSDMTAWTKSYAAMSVAIAQMRHDYLYELTEFLRGSKASAHDEYSTSRGAIAARGQGANHSAERSAASLEHPIQQGSGAAVKDNRSTAFGKLNLAGFPGRSIEITLKHGFGFEPGESQQSNIRLFLKELDKRREAELSLGRTLSGPGRCDLVLRDSDVAIKDHLSRGQGKLLAAQLLLGQMAHLEIIRGKSAGVILIDDLYSELDYRRADAVIRHATAGQAQIFITVLASSVEDVPVSLRTLSPGSMFHVEHSGVRKWDQSHRLK